MVRTVHRMAVIALACSCVGFVGDRAMGQETGPSSSDSPYILPVKSGVRTVSILTVGDSVPGNGGPYRMAGIPDGMGAWDNGDGTILLIMNHELSSTRGVVRLHGAIGAFVSRWIIYKDTLAALDGQDLIQRQHR